MKRVRNHLLTLPPTSDDEYLESGRDQSISAELLLGIRESIAEFFTVPTEVISRKIRFNRDFRVDKLQLGFQFFVVENLLQYYQPPHQPVGLSMMGVDDIDSLAERISDSVKESRDIEHG